MNNVVVAVRGGRVVEIYAEDRKTSFTVVDWDESAPDQPIAPDAYDFPAVPLSRLPAETLAAYQKAREQASDTCLIVRTRICFDLTLKDIQPWTVWTIATGAPLNAYETTWSNGS